MSGKVTQYIQSGVYQYPWGYTISTLTEGRSVASARQPALCQAFAPPLSAFALSFKARSMNAP